MIKTNVFFDFIDFQESAESLQQCKCRLVVTSSQSNKSVFGAFRSSTTRRRHNDEVREIFMIHVGGTRCVTSSTDNITKIHARITLTVEFIRTCIFIFLLDV